MRKASAKVSRILVEPISTWRLPAFTQGAGEERVKSAYLTCTPARREGRRRRFASISPPAGAAQFSCRQWGLAVNWGREVRRLGGRAGERSITETNDMRRRIDATCPMLA